MLLGTQAYFAHKIDSEARRDAERIVTHGLARYERDIAFKAVAQVYWDDAIYNLDQKFDTVWADEYVGDYLWEVDGVERTLIFDRDDQLRYVGQDGKVLDVSAGAPMAAAVAPLLRQIRGLEAKRPLPPIPLRDDQRLDPIVKSGTMKLDGHYAIVSATLVQPDARAKPVGKRLPVVIFAKVIDPAMVRDIGTRFLLSDLRLEPAGTKPERKRAELVMMSADGHPVAALTWEPRRPGTALVSSTLPALLAAIAVMAGLAALAVRRTRRLADQLVESEDNARELACTDVLTGLPNRAGLVNGFASARRRLDRQSESFAVLCIDLDHFKSVNDSFGHAAGDELIAYIGNKLASLRARGDFIARLGGDEFVLIQRAANRTLAEQRAETLIRAIVEPIELTAGRVFIGASIGVLVVDDASIAPDEALRRADMALYQAKDLGRNRAVVFEPSMDDAARSRVALISHLRQTLEQGGLNLVYQPQVDRNGVIVGLEALVRWTHPELGEVPPARFIPIAEETGLIDWVGDFTLQRAFSDAARFGNVRIAVNLSAAQLRRPNFVSRVERMAQRHGIDPSRFELEITEGILLGDDPQTHASLEALHDMGFSIALDDFGTGYSSLGYLQKFPIDKLKIDRSFVARIGVEKRAEALVQAIVRLAHSLGLQVVAEGVETEAQWLSLLVAGCPQVQGFLTGRPMQVDEVAALLASETRARIPA